MSPPEEKPESVRTADKPGMLRSTFVTGSMTFLSRISGLAREIGFSRWFGASPVMEAFIVAFRIPNLLRRFFAEGAFAQAFVPVFSQYRSTRPEKDAKALADNITGTLGAVLLLVSIVGVVAAPIVLYIFAPGWEADANSREMAESMLRLTFPYIFFIALTALAGAIINSHRQFAAPAFTPVLLNVVLIVFAGVVAPRTDNPALALASGVFVAGLVQLLFQIPFLASLRMLPRPRWGWSHPGVKRTLTLMLPVIFGSSVAQINILIDTVIASFLVSGSISWLYYSDRLMEFPLGVFGIALATVIMPSLSENHAQRSAEAFSHTIDWALRFVLIIALPAAIGLILLAEPLVATIYFGGEFTQVDVAMATASLIAFAPGLIGFILVKVLAPGFFARQDTKTPVRIAVTTLAIGLLLNILFVVTLTRTGWAPAHAGLAAATSVSAFINASLLLTGLLRAGVYRVEKGWPMLALKVVTASAAMGLVVWYVSSRAGEWAALSLLERIGWLAVTVSIAIAVYFGLCWMFGLRLTQLRSQATARKL